MSSVRVPLSRDGVQIPPELLRSIPRDVGLTGLGRFAIAVALSFVLGAVCFTVVACVSASRTSALKREMTVQGRLASGVVIDSYRTGGDSKRDVFIYEYLVDGRTYRGRTTTAARKSLRYPVGSSVAVHYLPLRPSESWLDGHAPSSIPLVIVPFVTGALLAGAWAIFWSVRRQRELLAEGRPTLALIRTVTNMRGGNRRQQRATIEFTLLSGAVHEGRLDFARGAPQPGSTAVIIYDRDNPDRLMRYPSQVVRVQTPGM